MWILVSEKTDQKYRLIVNRDYSVGRKDVDILIKEDPSISRNHASLQVSHSEVNMTNPEKKPMVLLKDDSSKYGTFVNTKQVKVETVLKEGDVITFGQIGSNFLLTYEPLIVTTSSLNTSSKAEIRKVILSLGGHLISDWRANCTHLIMSEIKVTVKAVCAMLSMKPLVLPNYFSDMLERCQSTTFDVLITKNYIPPVGEETLAEANVNFDVLPTRANLFHKKNFLFLSDQQYKKLHVPVTMAGGRAVLFEFDEPVEEEMLLHPNTCVVHSQMEGGMSSQMRGIVSKIENILRRDGKRTIPESDIGLAVVYCSLEKFCNPDSKPEFLQMSQLPSQSLSQDIYVPETQPVSAIDDEDYPSSQMSVPETLFSTLHQGGNISDDETTIEDDENTSTGIRKRFRQTSSDDSVRAPSPKQARIEVAPSRVKVEQPEEEEMITWDDDADTQPIPSIAFASYQEQTVSKKADGNNGKMQEVAPPASIGCPSTSFAQDIDDASECNEVPETLSLPSGFRPSKRNPSDIEHRTHTPDYLDVLDKDLPSKLMKITFAPLVRKSGPQKDTEPVASSTGKNFKKFKKTLPNSGHRLPRIIGGKDLLVFRQKNGAREVEMWLNDENDLADMENNQAFSQRQAKKSKRR